MSTRLVVGGLIGAGLAACDGGGGSVVPGHKPLASLSHQEIGGLCSYFYDWKREPSRRIDCGAVTITVGLPHDYSECRDDLLRLVDEFPSCAATVADFEACAGDPVTRTDEQLCAREAPGSCAALSEPGCPKVGSGVGPGRLLVSLTGEEITGLCVYAHEVRGPERTIRCDRNRSITVGGGADEWECTRSVETVKEFASSCTLTVQDVEDCLVARAALTDEQLCFEEEALPPACQVLLGNGCDE